MVEVIDYRVSRIVVLCKDCGEDVGLYPARHKCGESTLEVSSKKSNKSKSESTNSKSSNNSEGYNGYNLWNKFMTSATSITAMYNVDGDSDNESEKDDWDGETHISRILREHYENKGGNLPKWLYDSDSKDSLNGSYESQTKPEKQNLTNRNKNNYSLPEKQILTKRNENNYSLPEKQILTNRNENNYSLPEINNNRGRQGRERQPRPYNDSTRNIPPIQSHTPPKMNRGRDKSAPPPNSFDRNNNNDKYYKNAYPPLPKNIDPRVADDRIDIKNSNYPPRRPPPFPTTPNETRRLAPPKKSKSYNQLREQHYDSTSNRVSPNRNIGNEYNYNNNYNNVQKGRGRQDVPRVQNRNYF